MRRFFSTTFILLALLVGTAGAAPAVHAQTCPAGYDYDANEGCQPISTGAETCKYGYMYDANAGCIPAETTAGTSVDPAAEKIALDSKDKKDEGFDFIMIKIMTLFAWLVGVAALTLNYAVYYTVVTMGDYVHNLSAIGVTWRILRDIANIMFIFGFLGAGIATILNIDQYGWKTKMLPMLVVGAVFLNFSLFITEAMIDTTNLFATQFYTQIVGGTLPKVNSSGLIVDANGATLGTANEGISNKIMGQLGLQAIYGEVQNTKKAETLLKAGNSWLIGFMGILLFIITAFVMFSLAFILIARFVTLIFFMILSPVGFMGLAIPQMQARAGQWWSNFLEQIITAPVLLLLLYVALAVITDVNFLTGFKAANTGSGWLGTITNDLGAFAPMLLSFLVAMGLLLMVVIKAKSMSAFGAKGAIQLGGKLTFGATAWGMRNSGGWLANKTAQGLRKTWVARVPLAGTGLVKGFDKLGSASFDVRGIKAGGGLKTLQIDAGEAQKGGYKADLKERTESRTKYAGDLKGRELTDEEKLRQTGTRNEIKDLEKAQKAKGAEWVVADKNRKEQLAVLQGQRVMLSDEEYKAREAAINSSMTSIDRDVKRAKEAVDEKQKELEKIESVTDTGAKRKYARNLQLGLDEKGFFNKYVNFAANTEAAKKILKEAKETTDDKALKDLQKAIKAAAVAEAETAPPAAGAATPTAGAGGAAPATPATPPAAH
ncbi:MAG: hypothetical protein PHD04_02790 [Candidatus Pacebacteria bacterium]|nr:hypothetical protein [Candidatus Paceibacterota bacterium]